MKRALLITLLLICTTMVFAIDSAKSGNWSATDTWVGGAVPSDGTSATIKSGHTVVFDVDQSSFPNGIMLTIDSSGTLTTSTTPGTYYMKISSGIAGLPTINGTWEVGNTTTAYPTNCFFTLYISSSKYITGAGNKYFIGTDPTTRVVKLKSTVSIGGKVLTVVGLDGSKVNLSGDAVPWKVGDTIGVCDSASTRPDTDSYLVIESFSTDGNGDCVINTTAAGTGVVTQKDADSCVYLCTRNVRVIGGTFYAFSASNTYLCCEITGFSYFVYNVNNLNVSGGCYYNNSQYAFNSCYNSVWENAVFGKTAYPYSLLQSTNARVNNCYFIGSGTTSAIGTDVSGVIENSYIFGNNYGNRSSSLLTFNTCTFAYNGIVQYNSVVNMYNCTLIYNGVDMSTPTTNATFKNVLFTVSGTDVGGFSSYTPQHLYIESFDHNQVLGAYKSWTSGGTTIDTPSGDSNPYPVGYTKSYKLTLNSASIYGFYQQTADIRPGETVKYRMYIKKTVSMTTLPKIQIIDTMKDPIERGSSFTSLAEATMTDSTDTWEYYDLSYTNTSTNQLQIYLRVVGKNGSGSIYFLPVRLNLKEGW